MAVADSMTLKDIGRTIDCALFVPTGENDKITPPENTRRYRYDTVTSDLDGRDILSGITDQQSLNLEAPYFFFALKCLQVTFGENGFNWSAGFPSFLK